MEAKVTHVTLVVTDQARSLAFYTEKLGFDKKADVTAPSGFRWLSVGPHGQELELVLWPHGAPVDPTQESWADRLRPGGSPPLQLWVPNCTQTFEELRARGVEFPQPPKENPWSTNATFRDPDGNLFVISSPKGSWSASA